MYNVYNMYLFTASIVLYLIIPPMVTWKPPSCENYRKSYVKTAYRDPIRLCPIIGNGVKLTLFLLLYLRIKQNYRSVVLISVNQVISYNTVYSKLNF